MSANKLPVYTSRTVDSLAASSNDLSIPISDGAYADYGFDPVIYAFNCSPTPTTEQFSHLRERYREILSQTDGIEKLNSSVRQKKLLDILGEGFEWVRNTSNLI